MSVSKLFKKGLTSENFIEDISQITKVRAKIFESLVTQKKFWFEDGLWNVSKCETFE